MILLSIDFMALKLSVKNQIFTINLFYMLIVYLGVISSFLVKVLPFGLFLNICFLTSEIFTSYSGLYSLSFDLKILKKKLLFRIQFAELAVAISFILKTDPAR